MRWVVRCGAALVALLMLASPARAAEPRVLTPQLSRTPRLMLAPGANEPWVPLTLEPSGDPQQVDVLVNGVVLGRCTAECTVQVPYGRVRLKLRGPGDIDRAGDIFVPKGGLRARLAPSVSRTHFWAMRATGVAAFTIMGVAAASLLAYACYDRLEDTRHDTEEEVFGSVFAVTLPVGLIFSVWADNAPKHVVDATSRRRP